MAYCILRACFWMRWSHGTMVCGVGILASSRTTDSGVIIFDASKRNTLLGADGSPITAVNGTPVAKWNSNITSIFLANTGGGNVVYSTTNPAYANQNGRDAVCITDSILSFVWAASPSFANKTLFLVGAIETNATGTMFGQYSVTAKAGVSTFWMNGTAGLSLSFTYLDIQSHVKYYNGSLSVANAARAFAVGINITNLSGGGVSRSSVSSDSSTIYKDTYPSGVYMPTDTTTDFVFNVSGGKTWLHEMRVYKSALSDQDMAAVLSQLRAKWTI